MSVISMVNPFITKKLNVQYEEIDNEDSFSFNVLLSYYGIKLSKKESKLVDLHFYAACHHKSIHTNDLKINKFHECLKNKHINTLIKIVHYVDNKWEPHSNWLDQAYKDPSYAPFTYHKYDILLEPKQ